ncbi:MAG: hypothetical protein IJT87_13375 [Ruminiclostridium sp.]|nr:hypothetical protein [Ruminiclostridium sp.]
MYITQNEQYTQSLKELYSALNWISTIWWIYAIIIVIEFICIIAIAINLSKITKIQTQPFQNKKPEYPDKVIELLQAIVSAEQHNNSELQSLKSEMELLRNGGTKPGIKNKETIHHEEIVTLIKAQNDLLQKILDTTSGEEKKKLAERLKQATDILNGD